MAGVVVLDTGPLGLATNPRLSGVSLECFQWVTNLVANGGRVIVPELADYEVRRELFRADKARGLRRLETVTATLEYLPITTAAMRKAAEFWADARRRGRPTADDKSLDADVILAAQAVTLYLPDVIVATTNVDHLIQFIPAAEWREIQP